MEATQVISLVLHTYEVVDRRFKLCTSVSEIILLITFLICFFFRESGTLSLGQCTQWPPNIGRHDQYVKKFEKSDIGTGSNNQHYLTLDAQGPNTAIRKQGCSHGGWGLSALPGKAHCQI